MYSLKTGLVALYEVSRISKYRLDEYPILDGKKHPFAIICPGGGYKMIANHVEGKPFAQKLNEMGYSAFVLWYGCKKKAAYPMPIDDLAKAVKSLLDRADELGLDTTDYSVWGSSAGGHLTAIFGTENNGWKKYGLPKPSSLVLIYPVVSMGEKAHAGSKKRFIGKRPSPEAVALTSVENNITPDYPPTFCWCGDEDKCVQPVNSSMLDESLAKAGVRHELNVYHGVGHGVGLGYGTPCEGWFEKAVSFWRQN